MRWTEREPPPQQASAQTGHRHSTRTGTTERPTERANLRPAACRGMCPIPDSEHPCPSPSRDIHPSTPSHPHPIPCSSAVVRYANTPSTPTPPQTQALPTPNPTTQAPLLYPGDRQTRPSVIIITSSSEKSRYRGRAYPDLVMLLLLQKKGRPTY